MIPVQDALRLVLEHTPVSGTSEKNLLDARGYVLAEEVRSDMNMPPFDKSAMDGYAVMASDVAEASRARPVVLEIVEELVAGRMPTRAVSSGQAAKIMTGAPVPEGADAVVIVEVTEQAGSKVNIFEPCKKLANICFLGEDIREGDVVLESGKVLRAQEVGVLASVGRTKVRVLERPQVAVIATGSEIVEPNIVPRPGQIRNSNGYSLSAQVVENGCPVRYLGIVGDTKPELEARIREGLEADVLILSGGVSMGAYDLVKETLGALGVRLFFEKVRMKPGKPTVFGIRDKTLVFGLPGNPVSTIVAFEQFVRPAIRKMAGYRTLERPRVHAVLGRAFGKKPGRRLFAPAMTVHGEGGWHTDAVDSHGSADLLAMTRANSFLIVPEEVGVLEAGEMVEVQLLDCGFGIADWGAGNPKSKIHNPKSEEELTCDDQGGHSDIER